MTEKVTAAVTENVTVAVTERVTAAVTQNVTVAVTEKMTAAVTANVNAHVTDVLTAAERRLSSQAQALMEAVRSEARSAAQNYGAILDGINQRLDRIEGTVNANHRDTTAILNNHNESARSHPV